MTGDVAVDSRRRADLIWGAALVALATAVRLAWVLAVPTVPVSDFAMYRESADYLCEFGRLDSGFIYMPGFVALLAWVKSAGGDLLAQKLIGVAFGGLGAGALFLLARGVLDGGADAAARLRRFCPCPGAVVTTALYALWPAGVAMTSVVGTDVPAAALLALALALLVTLAPRQPWPAALAFGVAMGFAAWVRAVALPLSALSLGYWLARREPVRRALALTAAGIGATLVVLAPWGAWHLRQSGSLYFTDDHGGITALIGSNPNSEGAYTRALNQLFKDVSGRSVLAEPHHATDHIAYAIAREWTRFEPAYALGLVALKADRLFDPEQRLLYWPLYRNGVLVGPRARWFATRHDAIAELADDFGLVVACFALAGVAIAAVRRRWTLLALVPFQAALIVTYTLFFAEPRYRLPIELLAFPFVTLTLTEVARAAAAAVRRSRAELLAAAQALLPALAIVAAWRVAWPAALASGQALRAKHRWAVTEIAVPDGKRMLFWRPAPGGPPWSPIEGAPNGVHLRVDAGTRAQTNVELRLGGGSLPPGDYVVRMRAAAETARPARLTIGPRPGRSASSDAAVDVSPGAPAAVALRVAYTGGPLALAATLSGAPGASVWIDEERLELIK